MIGLMALAAMLAPASDGPIERYPAGWDLFRNPKNCAIVRIYGQTSPTIFSGVRFAYYPGDDMTRVTVFAPELNIVNDGDRYDLRLHFVTDRPTGPDDRVVKATTIKAEMQGYIFAVPGRDMLRDLRQSTELDVISGTTVIGRYKVDLIDPALTGMEKCAGALGG